MPINTFINTHRDVVRQLNFYRYCKDLHCNSFAGEDWWLTVLDAEDKCFLVLSQKQKPTLVSFYRLMATLR